MTLPTTTDDPPRDAWRGPLTPGQRLAHDAVAADLLAVSRTTTRTELRGEGRVMNPDQPDQNTHDQPGIHRPQPPDADQPEPEAAQHSGRAGTVIPFPAPATGQVQPVLEGEFGVPPAADAGGVAAVVALPGHRAGHAAVGRRVRRAACGLPRLARPGLRAGAVLVDPARRRPGDRRGVRVGQRARRVPAVDHRRPGGQAVGPGPGPDHRAPRAGPGPDQDHGLAHRVRGIGRRRRVRPGRAGVRVVGRDRGRAGRAVARPAPDCPGVAGGPRAAGGTGTLGGHAHRRPARGRTGQGRRHPPTGHPTTAGRQRVGRHPGPAPRGREDRRGCDRQTRHRRRRTRRR